MEFHYKYTITRDEYAEFNAYTGWYAPWCRKIRISYFLKTFLYAAVSATATTIILHKIQPPKRDNSLTLAIILFILVLIITYIYYINAPSKVKTQAKKLLEKEENKHILIERCITISDSGFVSVGATYHSNLKWESITRYANTKDYFYLYLNSMQGYVIPKRIVSPKSEIEQLDKFLTEKIPLESSFRSLGI